MPSPRLSLCMIVKNEEVYLPNCLASVAEIVDEMIVVDTGSTDKTKEIAASFGAKIFDYEWQGDFAAARNFSLSKATGDWILIMDGDDELAPEARNKIRDLLYAGEEIQGYRLPIISFLGDSPGGPCSTVYHARIFRNRPEYRYTGALHEQLPFNIYDLCPETTYKIYHYGYLAKVVEEKDKTNRNLVLAEQEFAEEPQSLFKRYNLGAELLRAGEFDRGKKLLQEVTGKVNGLEAYAPSAFQKLALCLVEQKELDDALETARLGWQKCGWDLSLLYLQGVILLAQGKTLAAVRVFEECLALRDSIRAIVYQGAGDSLALGCLSSAFTQLGRQWAAVECAAEAYRVNPKYSFALRAVVAYLFQFVDRDEARHYLAKRCFLPENEVDGLMQGWPEDHRPGGYVLKSANPLISVCLITKDEAENLRMLLGPITGIADEIIVVDTGSTDDTVSLAEKYGAMVTVSPWQDDFGRARNEALKLAKGKWVLSLDADMEISLAECGKIRRLAENGKADAYTFTVLNHLGGNAVAMKDKKIMMFRNRDSYRYRGPVYERLLLKGSGKKKVVIEDAGVIINHHGFNSDLPGFAAKRERNIKILQRELEKRENPFDRYCLAAEYMQIGKYPEAKLALVQASRQCNGEEAFYPDIIRKQAVCLFNLNDYKRAKEIIHTGLKKYGAKLADLNSLLGNIHLRENNYREAEKVLEQSIQGENGDNCGNYAYEPGREQGYIDLARVCLEKGQWGEGVFHCLHVLQRNPAFTPATVLLSETLKKYSEQKNVEVFLERYFNLSSDEVLLSLARAFMIVDWPALSLKLLSRIDEAWANREAGVLELKLEAFLLLLEKVLGQARESYPDDSGIDQAWAMWQNWCQTRQQSV